MSYPMPVDKICPCDECYERRERAGMPQPGDKPPAPTGGEGGENG